MIVKGCSSIAQLKQISIFQDLAIVQLESLVPYSYVREYQQNEIIMHEGDVLPLQLHALISCNGNLSSKVTNINHRPGSFIKSNFSIARN